MRKHFAVVALSTLAGIAIGATAVQKLNAQPKPKGYAVVEIDVTSEDAYMKEYAPTAGKALTDAGGKYLARGGKVVGIDGDPPKKRVVILEFENLDKAQAAFASAPYRDNRKVGDKYAKFRVFALEGLAQ
jgi:uncharacterized protein (DUF1330 family)